MKEVQRERGCQVRIVTPDGMRRKLNREARKDRKDIAKKNRG